MFEDANGKLKEMYCGTQAVPEQMVKNFLLFKQVVSQGAPSLESAPSAARQLFCKLSGCKSVNSSMKNERFGSGLVSVGVSNNRLTRQEALVLAEYLQIFPVEISVKVYSRFIFQSKLYASSDYCQSFGRDDSYIVIKDKEVTTFGRIQKLVVCMDRCNCPSNSHSCESSAFIFYNEIQVQLDRLMDDFVNMDLKAMFCKMMPSDVLSPKVCKVAALVGKCIAVHDVLIALPRFDLD
jgi:hypothetical protein